MLITDDELSQPWAGGNDLLPSTYRHSRGFAPGQWVHSIVSPHELMSLLGRIIGLGGDGRRGRTAIDAGSSEDNDDMIRWSTMSINRRLLADQLDR